MMPNTTPTTPVKPQRQAVIILLLCLLILLVVAHIIADFRQQHALRVNQGQTIFQRTISEAAQVTAEDVSNNLFPINPQNSALVRQEINNQRYIKVAAWMNSQSFVDHYQPYIGDPSGRMTPPEKPVVWVTLVPQVQDFCQQFMAELGDPSSFSAAFRLKQFLGLNPHRSYQHFVELWVKPDDIFRPCPDPETDDTRCNLQLDRQTPPTVKNIADYPAFFQQLIKNSYQPDGAPWTRLGYTFDWFRGQRNVGASEYMLVPKANYLVAAAYSTEQYCAP